LRNIGALQTALILGGTVFAASLGVLGCLKSAEQSSARVFDTIEDLQPYVEPYKAAYINHGGTPISTNIKTEKSDGKVSFRFHQGNEATPTEVEEYAFNDREFLYLGNLDERYEPGIPLLKFPLRVGDKWEWSGAYNWGGASRKATAVVTTATEPLNTVVGEFRAVRSVVELSVETGSKDLHRHKLTFWFAPKRGIVRREFEFSTTREPMPANEP
jgi:hypothetical protein